MDCCPPGKGRNRAGPSSRDEAGVLQPLLHRTQERWWPSTNPGSVSLEPGFTQTQCLHMLPPFGQDVASIAPFSGRHASMPLRQAVTTNRKDLKTSFTEG